MIWNWNTIDGESSSSLDEIPNDPETKEKLILYSASSLVTACFISKDWRIRSTGDYVGSLIGVSNSLVALALYSIPALLRAHLLFPMAFTDFLHGCSTRDASSFWT
jgi:hypothetical protein